MPNTGQREAISAIDETHSHPGSRRVNSQFHLAGA